MAANLTHPAYRRRSGYRSDMLLSRALSRPARQISPGRGAFARTAAGLGALLLVLLAGGCSERSADPDRAATAKTAAVSGTGSAAGTRALFGADTLSDSALLARADRGRVAGKESAPMWVVMISDFQCPYCKTWHDTTSAAVHRDYVETGKVRMAYLHLPLPQHRHARAEAEASLCAGVQGKFWPYADGLFHQQDAVARMMGVEELVDSLARANGLDLAAFAHCRQSKAIRDLVESDIAQATRAGVQSTPSFLVGDFLVQGALKYPEFRRAIDTALVIARSKQGAR